MMSFLPKSYVLGDYAACLLPSRKVIKMAEHKV
jgi:hypothetical protein